MILYETNSKLIKKGQIFVAIKGHTVDGHDYIDEAIKNGASKIVGEKDLKLPVEYLKVSNSEEYLKNELVKNYSNLFKNMKIIGVTGTNGKTTTCFLMYEILKFLKQKVAYLGTIGFFIDEKHTQVSNTTPDILNLYKLLLEASNKKIEYFIMEVSSHALSFERIKGLEFSCAGFTNLTEDHLDYHKTMENYLNEKLKILNYIKKDGFIILNNDDKSSEKFKKNNFKTIGINADYKINNYEIFPNKTILNFNYNNQNFNVTTNLTSMFNIYNYLMAIAILNTVGFKINNIINITKNIYAPKGRCETLNVKNAFAVIDYAHTPDAVEKVIKAYNSSKKAKIITIIGCGGDRDPLKRPIMGKIATENSDYVIITNDNPRTEDPKKIINDIIKGIKKNNYEIIFDRKKAILSGLKMLKKDDIILILGKGHEDYQIIGHDKIHFDDSEIVKEYLSN